MARRKDDNFIDVFSAIFSRTSPWLCVPCALLAWAVIKLVVQVVAAANPMLSGVTSVGGILAGFAGVMILLAGLSAFAEQAKRRSLLAKQSGLESIRGLSWSQFELLVGEVYRQQGYEVCETGQGGADGGIDLMLRRAGGTILVQCKQWKSWKVGVTSIREFYGVLMSEKAARGIFITSGVFTAEARAFANGKPLELLDGAELTKLVRPSGGLPSPTVVQTLTVSITSPACPKCGGDMVQRTAKRGANAGSQFWGCSGYPGCRGTRSM